MSDLSKAGGVAALFMALAYAVTIYIFLVLLDYPNITDAAQRLDLLVNRTDLVLVTNLLSYVAFGVALVVLVVALHDRLRASNPALVAVAGALGLIWAGSLVASGMVANAGIEPALQLFATDPERAAQIWAQTEAVASGLGNGNGEVLGGLMTLLFSWAGFRSAGLPKLLGLWGAATGLIGLASVVPGLVGLAGIFGIAQIVWFAGLAFVLLRGRA
jgi:Domain of unknown function (DUF4386)